MKIIVIDGAEFEGVGGALRGREMAFGLHSLGHEVQLAGAVAVIEKELHKPAPPEAVILTGTWHQLLGGGDRALTQLNNACRARSVPCIWWYGSNGSVWGSVAPNAAEREAEKQKIIDLIQARPFIAVICPYSMDVYEREGISRDKMRLVPSVFDGDLFTPEITAADRHLSDRLRFDYRIPAGAFTLGTTGHCPSSKGADDVLRAMAILKPEMPDLFYIIHHTPLNRLNKVRARSPDGLREGLSEYDTVVQTMELAKSLGLSENCLFMGMRRPRDAMPAIYRLMRVYCSPSKAENLGQPLVESQLCGIPLVTYQGFSFDFCSCPDTATQIPPDHTETDDYGLVIPFVDPAVLAEGIRKARHVAESGAGSAVATRAWAYRKFHHHNAKVMIDAITEYRSLM